MDCPAETVKGSSSAIEDDPLIDDGQWHSYAVAFDPYQAGLYYPRISGNTPRIMLEDWAGSTGIAGDALFDNIRLSTRVSTSNGQNGVQIRDGQNDVIGGTNVGDGNVISGNLGSGVAIDGYNHAGNLVLGNYIGTDLTGEKRLPNVDGVFIASAAAGNRTGGPSEAERNIISGNHRFGIGIANTLGTIVQGNYIGTNPSGTRLAPI